MKSNGTPIGIYHLTDIWEQNGKLFFNGKYRSTVDEDGKLFKFQDLFFKDSNCTIPISSHIRPGAVFRIPDKDLSYKDENNNVIHVYKDIPYYVPLDA